MSEVHGDISFVEIPSPGRGNILAEEAATLILQELNGVPDPTRSEVLNTVAVELDDWLSFVAVDPAGRVVGTGGLMLLDEPAEGHTVAGIVNMVVKPSERNHGLGTRIISLLEERAVELKAREAFLSPRAEALPFYEKLGYQPSTRSYTRGTVYTKLLA